MSKRRETRLERAVRQRARLLALNVAAEHRELTAEEEAERAELAVIEARRRRNREGERRRRAADPSKAKAASKRWRENNREANRETARRWERENREVRLERRRKLWRLRNPRKVKVPADLASWDGMTNSARAEALAASAELLTRAVATVAQRSLTGAERRRGDASARG